MENSRFSGVNTLLAGGPKNFTLVFGNSKELSQLSLCLREFNGTFQSIFSSFANIVT